MIRGSTSECHRSSVRPRNILCAVSEGKRSRGRSSARVRASTETEERDGDPRPRRRDRGAAPFPRVHVPRRASVGGDAGAPPSPAFRILTLAPRNRPPSPPSPIGSSAGARPPRVAPGVVARPRRPRRRSRTSRREQTPPRSLVSWCVPPDSLPPVPSPSQPPSPRRVVTDPEALTSPPPPPSPSPLPVPTRDGSSSASSPSSSAFPSPSPPLTSSPDAWARASTRTFPASARRSRASSWRARSTPRWTFGTSFSFPSCRTDSSAVSARVSSRAYSRKRWLFSTSTPAAQSSADSPPTAAPSPPTYPGSSATSSKPSSASSA